MRQARATGLLALVLGVPSCRTERNAASYHVAAQQPAAERRAVVPRAAPAGSYEEILPERIAGLAAAGSVEHGDGYLRRSYVLGEERVEITVARSGGELGAYDKWVAGSADYAQVALALPPGEANGFLTCASERADAACDLHVQMRAGFHIEMMGNGRVPRPDMLDLGQQFPLAALLAPDASIR